MKETISAKPYGYFNDVTSSSSFMGSITWKEWGEV